MFEITDFLDKEEAFRTRVSNTKPYRGQTGNKNKQR